MVLLVGLRAGRKKPSHGDVVGISDSGRYSAIARIMGNPEVDPGGPEVLLWEISPDRYWETRIEQGIVWSALGPKIMTLCRLVITQVPGSPNLVAAWRLGTGQMWRVGKTATAAAGMRGVQHRHSNIRTKMFLDNLSNSGLAVRRYSEGGAENP